MVIYNTETMGKSDREDPRGTGRVRLRSKKFVRESSEM